MILVYFIRKTKSRNKLPQEKREGVFVVVRVVRRVLFVVCCTVNLSQSFQEEIRDFNESLLAGRFTDLAGAMVGFVEDQGLNAVCSYVIVVYFVKMN